MPDTIVIKPAGGNSLRGLQCPLCRQRAHQHVMTYPGHSDMFRNRTVSRCVDCGLVYMYPMASTESLSAYYNSGTFWGHVSDTTPFDIPTYHHQAKARVDFIKDRMSFAERTDVLDIGAGYGVLESYLRKSLPGDVRCYAIEPDQKAQESLEKNDIRWSADLDAFAGTTFDLIVLSHVFEHINDPVAYLRNLRPFCHPDTRLFIEVPNEDFHFKMDLEPHVLFFSPNTLSAVLKAGGFRTVSVETCGLLQKDQRIMNQAIRERAEMINRLPFRNALKKLKNRFMGNTGSASLKDPLSAMDRYDCEVYGEGRVWIRCLAMLEA